MNLADMPLHTSETTTNEAVKAACRAIAPAWPLDRFVAVNPYWGWVDRPFGQAAHDLSRLSGTRMWMPRAFYRSAWEAGQFDRTHLAQAITECGFPGDVDGIVDALQRAGEDAEPLPLLSDVTDTQRDLVHAPSWHDTIINQIGQFCAARFDVDQASWQPDRKGGLYALWHRTIVGDHGISTLTGTEGISERAARLPSDAMELVAFALKSLEVPARHTVPFLTSVLLRVNGWASWCAYLGWQARLDGREDSHLQELLAIRLAWECLLDDGLRSADSVWARWHWSWRSTSVDVDSPPCDEAVWQRALEIAYQQRLAGLVGHPCVRSGPARPSVQAVFCIDVRSEVFRRALEQTADDIRTLGFAGFFGLPISYTPLGSNVARPQLPALLAPTACVTETCGDPAADARWIAKRDHERDTAKEWDPFVSLPGSAFSLVESMGLGYLGRLVARAMPSTADSNRRGPARASAMVPLRPRLVASGADAIGERVALAARTLHAMGLTGTFARLVVLVGHGSRTSNNPHAAGLDCGACGGQTGEVNARTLAAILNEPEVRHGLGETGVDIPEDTLFVAGLHDTTTDDVQLFDDDLVPASHAPDVIRLRDCLARAGHQARRERAPTLGLSSDVCDDPKRLARAVRRRANDWSQTRPEWGLANNAAFIVAPRARTRHLRLDGRVFLHDYDWQRDTDNRVLELIMTAPMVVANWINMQYYASTVDNTRYGSGNKVLHNVVGGRLGVFEGNGGDLRIGLPLQSLHDGTQWMHTPLRLSVFIEAPAARIESVIASHEVVRHLVHNEWLHLFRIDRDTDGVEAYRCGNWSSATRGD